MPKPSPLTPAGGKVLIGMLLQERGVISVEQLQEALEEQSRTGEYIGSILVKRKLVMEHDLMVLLAEQLGLPHVLLSEARIDPDAIQRVPAAIATRYQLMRIEFQGNRLKLAITDPLNVQVLVRVAPLEQ